MGKSQNIKDGYSQISKNKERGKLFRQEQLFDKGARCLFCNSFVFHV
ncbi:hypothetical protein [Staphylococcus equorum]|nr:hypothetical protein [Staphylococcus equorum]